jgi:signal transduction histidine kinase
LRKKVSPAEERNLLLGMMGHDMRNPLHVIQMSASYLAQIDVGDRAGVNLANLFADALEQLRVSHPGRQIELQVSGNVSETWDPHRLHQVLNNPVLNAIKYGAGDAPVNVSGALRRNRNGVHGNVTETDGQTCPVNHPLNYLVLSRRSKSVAFSARGPTAAGKCRSVGS